MMEEKTTVSGNQKLNLLNREKLTMTGINDVLSFDANEVLLDTCQGILMIRGDELHVSRLTLEKGEADIDGRIDSLTYSNQGPGKNGESIWNRLFK